MSPIPVTTIEGQGSRVAFVLHGILANRKNWRLYARGLSQALPGWRFVLVDMRGHGESHGFDPPHTVAACATDLATLADDLEVWPEVVMGHSFGGKVALAYADGRPPGLRRTFVLDSDPGAVHGEARKEDAAQLRETMAALEQVVLPAPSRRAVVDRLTELGMPLAAAQWLTTSLRPVDGGVTWAFDLPAARALVADYWRTDLWRAMEEPSAVHIRGGRSDRFTDAVLCARLDALGGVVLPTAGHWLQVDDPDGLRAALLERWPF